MLLPSLLSLVLGYLSGSIPFAVIIARARGVDIFKVGSGNPGATNVKRSVGKLEGNICFALDALKGFIPVVIATLVGQDSTLGAWALIGAILGHSFSVWIGWRGGKGVATTIGGLMGLVPLGMVVGLLIWIGVFYTSGYVSLASIAMSVWLPFGALIFGADMVSLVITTIVAALVVLRHKANIERLLRGTENGFKKSKPTK